jgi:hypothetical protein
MRPGPAYTKAMNRELTARECVVREIDFQRPGETI